MYKNLTLTDFTKRLLTRYCRVEIHVMEESGDFVGREKRKRKTRKIFSPCDYDSKVKKRGKSHPKTGRCSNCDGLIKRQKSEISTLQHIVACLSGRVIT